MFVTALVTFIVTTSMYAALAVWGTTRVVRHLRANRGAVEAVTEHVLMPLLGHSPQETKKPPVPEDARQC
jgi:hypothetical protein